MTFEVEVGGRVRIVSIESVGAAAGAGGRFRVLVDGVAHEIESRVTDLGVSLQYLDTHRGVDAAVTERGRGEYWIQLPSVSIPAVVDARRFRRGGNGPVATTGGQRVLAPMPGRVVRVLVAAGDAVAAGQGLVVVEAMKMENELTALRAGQVKDVAVTAGQSVESGRLLMTIE